MASKRRSVRERKAPVKYFKEDSSDDEEDNENIKAAKLKLKQMLNEDSDAESDFERELESIEAATAVVDSSSDSDSKEDGIADFAKKNDSDDKSANVERMREMAENGDKSLCLSESDSSEDEGRVMRLMSRDEVVTKERDLKVALIVDGEEEAEEQSSQKLLELAGNLERMKDVWKENLNVSNSEKLSEEKKIKKMDASKSKKAKSRKSTPEYSTKNQINLDSISKLLAVGEGVTADLGDVSEEDTKPTAHVVPKEGVEITIPLPQHLRKKKKKGFDIAAFLKRELSKARRELAVLQHKSHLTCLLAHLVYLHTSLSTSMLEGLALSIVPDSHCHQGDQLTLARLGSLLAWVREAIPVNRHKVETVTTTSIASRITRGLESLLVMSDMELVLVFVLICRALGYDTRLVLNCHTLPLKPSADGDKQTKVVEVPDDPSEAGPSSDNTNSSNAKTAKKRKCPLATGSDSEGEADQAEHKKQQNHSKKVTAKKDGNSKLSSKLSAAVKARTSKKKAPTAEGKDREEEMIKNLDKKYPTKQSKSQSKDAEPKPSTKSSSKSKAAPSSSTRDYWAEVFLTRESKWVPVDLLTGKLNCASELESKASKPVLYVLAINRRGRVKDVTQRYAGNFLTQTRKLRVEQDWLEETLRHHKDRDGDKEDRELAKKAGDAPLPTNVSAFKGHPLYVLQRHLLKFEAIYPSTAPTLGFIRGEGVYARECVHTLQGRTSWLKEGRVVRVGEEPYKVVKARPKWDRMSGSKVTEEPLEVFGLWQTELYIPPPAKDGKVPRNEYGNVELFKPWMLPVGCVQIPINGMARVIRQTGIDAAPAMVGWDFSGGGAHPVYDGYVVCQENAEALMDAWSIEQELKLAREEEKREKRVLSNWKRLVKGLMFREKIQTKYMKE
eukprot:GFUD01037861.1.p1 GENE.GFUD01037861.1~~GFUD01037861.1.p1  ORF type:complete len:898 (+),score=341.47 GFUD01037861.1:69-2762(+)